MIKCSNGEKVLFAKSPSDTVLSATCSDKSDSTFMASSLPTVILIHVACSLPSTYL